MKSENLRTGVRMVPGACRGTGCLRPAIMSCVDAGTDRRLLFILFTLRKHVDHHGAAFPLSGMWSATWTLSSEQNVNLYPIGNVLSYFSCEQVRSWTVLWGRLVLGESFRHLVCFRKHVRLCFLLFLFFLSEYDTQRLNAKSKDPTSHLWLHQLFAHF